MKRIEQINQFIPSLLLEKRFRFFWHLSLQLVLFLITINVFWDYPGEIIFTKDRFLAWIGYYGVMNLILYLNIFYLVPCFLLKDHLKIYLLLAAGIISAGLLLIGLLQSFVNETEAIEMTVMGILLNIISSLFSISLALAGTSALLLFRHWVVYNQRIADLESVTLQTELNYLKSQINPHFLFNMLNNANIMTSEDADTSSRILLQLEEMLRYQLDDSCRDRVLLSDDIAFVSRYLELEKTRRDRFIYQIRSNNMNVNPEIPPLLFIPFVENAVKHNADGEEESFVYLEYLIENDKLIFTCRNSKPRIVIKKESGGIGLMNIYRRLELLYGDKYTLQVDNNDREYSVRLEIPLIELND